MAMIRGRSLLERVWRIAQAVHGGTHEVLIATDDRAIYQHAEKFGAHAIMTPSTCINGSERAFAAVAQRRVKPDIVVNLQGDAALTPPWVVEAVIATLQQHPEIGLATPAKPLNSADYAALVHAKQQGQVSGTTVVFNTRGDALYFSKGIIPFVRSPGNAPVYHHIGLYGYRYDTLQTYVQLTPTPLEGTEQLEQLRALEHGIPIRVVPVDCRGRSHWSVDAPEDIARVEAIIDREGELT